MNNYKVDIQVKGGRSIKREMNELELRNYIKRTRFTSPLLYANIVTPSGVKKSILKHLRGY